MKVVSGKQMREIEQIAIEEMGIPSLLLMENAALRLTERCLQTLGSIALENSKNPRVVIICGQGNNGGDGMALARHLHNKGVETSVIFVGDIDAVKGDPSVYLAIIRKLGIPIETVPATGSFPDISHNIGACDLVVDAMLGTGLSRSIDGNYRNMIETINEHAKYVISVDIPSGVHADTGQIMGRAVKAAETITFAYLKIGVMVYPGAEYAGKVHIEDISLPAALIDRIDIKAQVLTDTEAGALLPVRKQRSNKGSFGKILVFAGSNEMPGAAALASSAAYMAGGGLVCACVVPSVASVIHHWQREVITRIVPDKNGLYCKKSIEALTDEINQAAAIVLGPGIGRGDCVTEFVREIISIADAPIVLDADALFAVSEDVNILKRLKSPCVITPHPGEMCRLTKLTVPEILDSTIDTAVRFSKEFNVVTLLKDARTIAACPDGNFYINTTGNNALSKAGTGDVLSGMIAGFIAHFAAKLPAHSAAKLPAQSALPAESGRSFTAAALSAYIHGKAGEAAALHKSRYGVIAADLLEYIPSVINELANLPEGGSAV